MDGEIDSSELATGAVIEAFETNGEGDAGVGALSKSTAASRRLLRDSEETREAWAELVELEVEERG